MTFSLKLGNNLKVVEFTQLFSKEHMKYLKKTFLQFLLNFDHTEQAVTA